MDKANLDVALLRESANCYNVVIDKTDFFVVRDFLLNGHHIHHILFQDRRDELFYIFNVSSGRLKLYTVR